MLIEDFQNHSVIRSRFSRSLF